MLCATQEKETWRIVGGDRVPDKTATTPEHNPTAQSANIAFE
jgi:hypothetical protein